VQFWVHDAQGNVVARSADRLRLGDTASFDVPSDQVPKRLIRAQLRASVRVFGEEPGLPPGLCIVTLELIDTESARTTAVLNPGVLRGFNPQPDPPLE
jgi:hypothetical protein